MRTHPAPDRYRGRGTPRHVRPSDRAAATPTARWVAAATVVPALGLLSG
ncbi:hypothetical protein [Nocardioides bizhenqiangii]|uniref:Uncharacterized protein n=1 Tax=Nocardioides bizhenqiangii TaxID=3095076 RepID=A0ABZ0ZQA3_9ACTN|nr:MULTISPECIES: hypothetical protein [unclassified Nocardioides]MDZ5619455.1 hypothetical protein [Nocardioides sp. HM23]WQQ26525.1 hypothetical protein SHK19_21545 [Nocardioides sp. HM61]